MKEFKQENVITKNHSGFYGLNELEEGQEWTRMVAMGMEMSLIFEKKSLEMEPKDRSTFARSWVGREVDYKTAVLRLFCNLLKLLHRIQVTIPTNSYSTESFWKILV